MLRQALLALSASKQARDLMLAVPASAGVVDRFVAGPSAGDALAVARQLVDDGRLVTLDHLGEETTDPLRAAAVTGEYLALLDKLADAGLTAGGRTEVSVKPTAVGLGLPGDGPAVALGNVTKIAARARNAGTTLTLDMEDHARVEATFGLLARVRADFPDVGCVVQSYLRRSEQDCRELAAAGSRVRLCKGAYQAPAGVALESRGEVDLNYVRCMRILLAGRGYPMLATHDPRLLRIAAVRAEMSGHDPAGMEYQMLYGVRPAEQERLVAAGARLRVYVPYGSDWYGYLLRRLAERPANLAFFARALASRR